MSHQRIAGDWQERLGQPLLLLETFVDQARFHGTVYRAANWACLGLTRGFRRTREGYSADAKSPKLVFILPVQRDARAQLSRPVLDPVYRTGAPRIMLTAEQMRTLPDFFDDIPDPRRAEGWRHRLAVGIIQFISDGKSSVAQKMQQLNRNTRLVFDYLRMTNNSTRHSLT